MPAIPSHYASRRVPIAFIKLWVIGATLGSTLKAISPSLPANIPASYYTEGDDHYFHVQIPTQFLKSVVQSAAELDSDRLELRNEFRIRNRQLEHSRCHWHDSKQLP